METIKNIANTATAAVWGNGDPSSQSGQEPVSGKQGPGEPDKPYDAGNNEDPDLGGTAAPDAGTEPPQTHTSIPDPAPTSLNIGSTEESNQIPAATTSPLEPSVAAVASDPTTTAQPVTLEEKREIAENVAIGQAGAGDQYVKSSGLAAEEGNPAASKQADYENPKDTDSPSGGKKKFTSKLKEKLHIGHH